MFTDPCLLCSNYSVYLCKRRELHDILLCHFYPSYVPQHDDEEKEEDEESDDEIVDVLLNMVSRGKQHAQLLISKHALTVMRTQTNTPEPHSATISPPNAPQTHKPLPSFTDIVRTIVCDDEVDDDSIKTDVHMAVDNNFEDDIDLFGLFDINDHSEIGSPINGKIGKSPSPQIAVVPVERERDKLPSSSLSSTSCSMHHPKIVNGKSKLYQDFHDEENFVDLHDDLCNVCGYGGHVICCDHCTLVYHKSCTSVEFQAQIQLDDEDAEFRCPVCTAEVALSAIAEEKKKQEVLNSSSSLNVTVKRKKGNRRGKKKL